VFGGCIPREGFSFATFFEEKIEWFFVFIFAYGSGTVTRREHVFSQVKPFLRPLFRIGLFNEPRDVWVHLNVYYNLLFKRLIL
jgi:hypothetical protein